MYQGGFETLRAILQNDMSMYQGGPETYGAIPQNDMYQGGSETFGTEQSRAGDKVQPVGAVTLGADAKVYGQCVHVSQNPCSLPCCSSCTCESGALCGLAHAPSADCVVDPPEPQCQAAVHVESVFAESVRSVPACSPTVLGTKVGKLSPATCPASPSVTTTVLMNSDRYHRRSFWEINGVSLHGHFGTAAAEMGSTYEGFSTDLGHQLQKKSVATQVFAELCVKSPAFVWIASPVRSSPKSPGMKISPGNGETNFVGNPVARTSPVSWRMELVLNLMLVAILLGSGPTT